MQRSVRSQYLDEDGVIVGQYSIMGDTLTVVIEDPEIDPPTATFVFTKAT